MTEFEKSIREIFFYVNEYGITNKRIRPEEMKNISEEDRLEFISQVHQGYRKGQKKILEQIIPLYEDLKSLKNLRKEGNQNIDKDFVRKIDFTSNEINYRIKILRHFADNIAWLFLKNHYYKARRFYSGNPNRPDLLNTNLESVVLTAEKFHSENKFNFALIADLTTFIDIGDIILLEEKGISIVECKSGSVQKKVFDFIGQLGNDKIPIKELITPNVDKKFLDQVKRTLNQYQKGTRILNFLKNEEGKDAFSEKEIKIWETKKPQIYYFDILIDLIEQTEEKGFATTHLNNIIYLGVFKTSNTFDYNIFNETVREITEKLVSTDYLQQIDIPLKEPLFFKPIGKEAIFDILFDRLKVIVCIDLDNLLDLFRKRGLKARWLSRKETHKYLDDTDNHKPFTHKNRAIEINNGGNKIMLGDSFLIYLLLDNLTPSSFVERYLDMTQGSP